MTMKAKYLIQYQIDGKWITCATRTGFKAATAKARSEFRAMKGAFMTAVIREDDEASPILRRRFDFNFEIA